MRWPGRIDEKVIPTMTHHRQALLYFIESAQGRETEQKERNLLNDASFVILEYNEAITNWFLYG